MGKFHSKLPQEAGTFRFGRIAIDRKYVTPEQLQEAIEELKDDCLTGSPYRLLGEILLDNNWITEEQVKSILEEMDSAKE